MRVTGRRHPGLGILNAKDAGLDSAGDTELIPDG
jgi:hypothetical protein